MRKRLTLVVLVGLAAMLGAYHPASKTPNPGNHFGNGFGFSDGR